MTRASQNPGPVTPQTLPQPDPSAAQLINLGKVALVDGESSVLLGPGKPLALLTYLRSIPGQSATREHLTDLLWADSAPSLGRQALRQTLTRLRQVLGDDAIQADREEVALSIQIPQDRASFLDAIERNNLPDAVTLYTGSFFPGFGTTGSIRFEHWADAERAYLLGLFLRAGESLARRHLAREPQEALQIARMLNDQASESESTGRLMLQAALAAGETVLAQSLADQLASSIKDADRTPEPATTRLIFLAREQFAAPEQRTGSGRLTADLVGREREFAAVVTAWSTAPG
ncbi:MAG: AfsR/SARP family transcriptional regulator, partial [Gemmatimonadales bacterium]